MFQYIITYNGEEVRVLSEISNKSKIIEDNVPYKFISQYYNQELKITCTKEKVFKKLYIIYTGFNDYDTYDSGVFCAYNKEQCLELAIKKSGFFNSQDIHEIGIANEDLELGEVCTSFNAG